MNSVITPSDNKQVIENNITNQTTQQTTPQITSQSLVETDATKTSLTTYIFISVCVVILLILMYYAYSQFVENSKCNNDEPNKKTTSDDHNVIDYNLAESIKDLENTQKKILQKLSSDVGI